MKYQANSTALSQSTDCLIIGIYENNELTKSFNEIDQITKGYLSQLGTVMERIQQVKDLM